MYHLFEMNLTNIKKVIFDNCFTQLRAHQVRKGRILLLFLCIHFFTGGLADISIMNVRFLFFFLTNLYSRKYNLLQ